MVDRIRSFTAGLSFDEDVADERTHLAVERCFQIIGEAVMRVRRDAPHLHARFADTAHIAAFCNVIVHVYDQVDHEIVWKIIHADLPRLRDQAEAVLREMEGEG